MTADVIEREEWLIALGILADIRAELEKLTELFGGADDEEAEEDT